MDKRSTAVIKIFAGLTLENAVQGTVLFWKDTEFLKIAFMAITVGIVVSGWGVFSFWKLPQQSVPQKIVVTTLFLVIVILHYRNLVTQLMRS